MDEQKIQSFERELASVFNRYSVDAALNTPDFVLATMVREQLVALEKAKSKTAELGYSEGVPRV